MRPHPVLPAGLDVRRRRLLASARGRVLDIGDGEERNLPHYPPGASVVFVDIDELHTLGDATFDTVVCMLVLCAAPDPAATLESISGLLADDGQLLLLEHVLAGGGRGVLQRLSAPAWERVFSGCRPDRDTVATVRDAGYLITDLDRFTVRVAAPVTSSAIQAVAKKRVPAQ